MDRHEPHKLSDSELAQSLKRLAADERTAMADFITHLEEFDRRGLAGPLGFPSLFSYCTNCLHLSENEAYKRIQAARASRKYPQIKAMLDTGELHLTAVTLLAPHLTAENHCAVLARACWKTAREVAMIVARLAPQPERRECIRRLPDPAPPQAGDFALAEACAANGAEVPSTSVASPPPPRIEPVAPDRVRFSFTGDEALLRKLERARAVLWHKHPAGRLEDIFAEALDFLLAKKDPELRLERQQRLKRRPPACAAESESRRIPQWVKDEVWSRDGGRCAFKAPDGARCPEQRGLEFDHIMPWALGGRSHDPANIRLLCRQHNQIRARSLSQAAALARRLPPPEA